MSKTSYPEVSMLCLLSAIKVVQPPKGKLSGEPAQRRLRDAVREHCMNDGIEWKTIADVRQIAVIHGFVKIGEDYNCSLTLAGQSALEELLQQEHHEVA